MSQFFRATITMFNSGVGLRGQNVLYFEDPSETKTPTQLAAMLDQEWWGSAAAGRMRTITAQLVRSESYTIQKVDPAPPSGGIPFTANAVGGAQATLVQYPTVGAVIQFFDGGAGARHRGRIYHYGTPSNYATNFVPNSTFTTAFNSVRAFWLDAFGPLPTSGFNLCLFHRDLTGSARYTRVTDIRLAPFFHHQRRRNFATGF